MGVWGVIKLGIYATSILDCTQDAMLQDMCFTTQKILKISNARVKKDSFCKTTEI